MNLKTLLLSAALLLHSHSFLNAQERRNPIITHMQVLDLGMYTPIYGPAEIGTVSTITSQITGITYNPALLANEGRKTGIIGSYAENNTDLGFLNTGLLYSFDEKNSISYSYQRLIYPENYFTPGSFTIKDYYHALRYGHAFEKVKLGGGIKIGRSSITNRTVDSESYNAKSLAFDFGVVYDNTYPVNDVLDATLQTGAAIRNLGKKIQYGDSFNPDFIPASLAVGFAPGINTQFSGIEMQFNLLYEATKWLVPTPPVYATDENGFFLFDSEDNLIIDKGMDPDVSALRGAIQSFYDAPYGFEEEMHEIIHKFGWEAGIKVNEYLSFNIKYGYFREHEFKGDRRFHNFGFGASIYHFYLYLAYNNSTYRDVFGSTPIALGYFRTIN